MALYQGPQSSEGDSQGLVERYRTRYKKALRTPSFSFSPASFLNQELLPTKQKQNQKQKLTNSITTAQRSSSELQTQIRKCIPRRHHLALHPPRSHLALHPRKSHLALRPLTSCRPRVVHRNDRQLPTQQLAKICALSSPGHS